MAISLKEVEDHFERQRLNAVDLLDKQIAADILSKWDGINAVVYVMTDDYTKYHVDDVLKRYYGPDNGWEISKTDPTTQVNYWRLTFKKRTVYQNREL